MEFILFLEFKRVVCFFYKLSLVECGWEREFFFVVVVVFIKKFKGGFFCSVF